MLSPARNVFMLLFLPKTHRLVSIPFKHLGTTFRSGPREKEPEKEPENEPGLNCVEIYRREPGEHTVLPVVVSEKPVYVGNELLPVRVDTCGGY